MTEKEIIKAFDVLNKLDFFGGQRAGRELWNEKPADIQNKDIESFSNDVEFLRDFITRQKAEIEKLKAKLLKIVETDIPMLAAKEISEKHTANITKHAQVIAVKEFAERLDDTKIKIGNDYVVYADNISVIKKEMVGDG
jgi:hypothetical protein